MKIFSVALFATACLALSQESKQVDLAEMVPELGEPETNQICDVVTQTKPSFFNEKIRIPCNCPPAFEDVVVAVSKIAVKFPDGLDLESRIRRFEITLQALQSLKCPAVSTSLKERLDVLTSLRGKPVDLIQEALDCLDLNDVPELEQEE